MILAVTTTSSRSGTTTTNIHLEHQVPSADHTNRETATIYFRHHRKQQLPTIILFFL
jgi:hypothetical protein